MSVPERGFSEGPERNRIGRREKWPKKGWEEGEIGGKVGRREKKKRNRLGRREKLAQKSREEGEIGSESREKGDLPPCPPPPLLWSLKLKVFLDLRSDLGKLVLGTGNVQGQISEYIFSRQIEAIV